MEVLLFGQLVEITKTAALDIASVKDTNDLLIDLRNRFPALQSATFVVAVNGEIIQANTPLDENKKVALLPPFSGG
jgi:molybdopterin synthase sulfur carrier subunit